jgi:peptide alpha-N-acetyltransferase
MIIKRLSTTSFANPIISNKSSKLLLETLAMKGLILNSMERKQEAYTNARKGVRYDLTSHICKCPASNVQTLK